jgi:hypothetical protein
MSGEILDALPRMVGEVISITHEAARFWAWIISVGNAIVEVWPWLLINHDGVRLVSSIFFGFGSLVVSLLAINVTYRNNFGWKPLVLLIWYGKASQLGKHVLRCRFEIWNRRKYPLVVREIQVSFGPTRLENEDGFMPNHWSPTARGNLGLRMPDGITLEPNQKMPYLAEWDVHSRDAAVGGKKPVEVWAHVYDPKNDSSYVIRAVSRRRWWVGKLLSRLKRQMPPMP